MHRRHIFYTQNSEKKKVGDILRPNAIAMHVAHVRNYLVSLKTSNKTLYAKTQYWLADLRFQLLDCCQIITDILGDGQLNNQVDSVDVDLSDLETSDPLHLFPNSDIDIDNTQDLKSDSAESNSADIPMLHQKPISTHMGSTKTRKHVIHSYGVLLHQLCSCDELSSDPNIVECAEILWRWYEIRFFLATNTSFHYNVRHIPVWIRNIVLVYARYVECGESEKFKQNFYEWLALVQTIGSEESCYGVPYEIHKLDVSTVSDDITITALKIWDILWNVGLCKLNDPSLSESRISDEYMYNFCEKYNSKIVDQYEDLIDNQKGVESL